MKITKGQEIKFWDESKQDERVGIVAEIKQNGIGRYITIASNGLTFVFNVVDLRYVMVKVDSYEPKMESLEEIEI